MSLFGKNCIEYKKYQKIINDDLDEIIKNERNGVKVPITFYKYVLNAMDGIYKAISSAYDNDDEAHFIANEYIYNMLSSNNKETFTLKQSYQKYEK